MKSLKKWYRKKWLETRHHLVLSSVSCRRSPKAAENILAGKYDSQRLFIVARKPDRSFRLIEAGVQLETLNVGNMSQSDETRAIMRSINVVDADVEDFNKIHEKV